MWEALNKEYEILLAEGGKEALRLINIYQERLSMILLDLYMPKVNGYQILKFMKSRARTKNIPVIAADNKSEKDVLLMGAVEWPCETVSLFDVP